MALTDVERLVIGRDGGVGPVGVGRGAEGLGREARVEWHQCVKPSRHDAATSRQDVAPFPVITAAPTKFHFPLSQQRMTHVRRAVRFLDE